MANCLLSANPMAQSVSGDRKSTRLNSSHLGISYAVFCLKKKKKNKKQKKILKKKNIKKKNKNITYKSNRQKRDIKYKHNEREKKYINIRRRIELIHTTT